MCTGGSRQHSTPLNSELCFWLRPLRSCTPGFPGELIRETTKAHIDGLAAVTNTAPGAAPRALHMDRVVALALPQEPHVPITRRMCRGLTTVLGCGAVLLWVGSL